MLRLQKRTRAPKAPRAPRKPRLRVQNVGPSRAGGTPAPAAAARGPHMGLSQARSTRHRIGVGPGHPAGPTHAPVEGGAAQAPVEVNTNYGPPPESANTAQKRQQAEAEFARIQGDVKTKLYLAALAYGDPELIKLYGDVTDNPASSLSTIARNEEKAKKENAINRNAANTFFSGMNLEDIRKIGDEAAIKRKEAYDEWIAAEQELNALMAEAEETRNSALSQADIEDLEAFEATQPAPQAGGSSPGGGGGGKGKAGGGGGGKGGKGKGGGKGGPGVGPAKPAGGGPSVSPNKPAKKQKGKK